MRDSKFGVVTIDSIIYQCATFYNFPASGSMGCHRHEQKKKKKKNANKHNRCLRTFGAWPLINILYNLYFVMIIAIIAFFFAYYIKILY